jgi:hypothetical protein
MYLTEANKPIIVRKKTKGTHTTDIKQEQGHFSNKTMWQICDA